MRKKKITQYPWGTERPSSKLDKIKARRRPMDRELDLIGAQARRGTYLRLQQDWVDMHQVLHIEAATMYGPYNPNAATEFPWVEECQDEKTNSSLAEVEAEIRKIETRKTAKEIEFDKFQAVIAGVRNRLCLLAAHLGRTDRETERKIIELVPGRVFDAVEMLGLRLDSEEVYFAFHGLEEDFPLPDATLGHSDFQDGWSNALQSYGGSAVTALATLLKGNASLKARYLTEWARQFMWPFFVERRERLRFYLRLHMMGCIEFDEIQQAMADFDERESPLPAAASELNIADHKPLTPVFDSIFKLLPWPDGLGPSS